MRLVLVLLGACGFSTSVSNTVVDAPSGSEASCTPNATWWNASWSQRFAIDLAGAPPGYTARIDAPAVRALSTGANGADIRVVVDNARELDRAVDGSIVEFRVPASGTVSLYVANAAATAAPSNPDAIYAWSESFDTLALNSDGAPRFAPATPADWHVIDDGGNRIYRVTGAGRHPNPIASSSEANVEIRTRLRVGPGGGQNHNGLLLRASNVVPATLDGFVGQILEDSEYSRVAEYIDGVSPPTERGTHLRPVDRATWYSMRMRIVGTTIEMFVDGAPDVSSNAGTANGTTFGLFAHDTDVDYDDIRVRRLLSPEPAFAVGARENVCD